MWEKCVLITKVFIPVKGILGITMTSVLQVSLYTKYSHQKLGFAQQNNVVISLISKKINLHQ